VQIREAGTELFLASISELVGLPKAVFPNSLLAKGWRKLGKIFLSQGFGFA